MDRDTEFLGRIPDVYQRLLVPMKFQEPANRLARAVSELEPGVILETAAGTGVLTRSLLEACPEATVVATDLNQTMLDEAVINGPETSRVTWRQADALDLPFDDHTFDVVACQFGVMFFPDRVRGHREAGRVLKPGGTLVFNVWGRLEDNEIAFVIDSALSAIAPELGFMGRTPHGYASPHQIAADLEAAGMPGATITPVDGTSHTTAADAATGFCQGTPLRAAIEQHGGLSVTEATAIAEDALAEHFGPGPIAGPLRWLEVVARPGR